MNYRSQEKEYMEKMKESVLSVTKGIEREDRKFALDYLRKHVKLDDLHMFAVKKFPNKPIVLGVGSYNARVMILTRNPITADAKVKLDKAWQKMKIEPEHIFYSHVRFVATKKKQDVRQEIIERLIRIISPSLLLTFDGLEFDAPHELKVIPYAPDVLINGTDEQRREVTRILKEVRPLILN